MVEYNNLIIGEEYNFYCKDIGEKGESIGTIDGLSQVLFSTGFLPGEEGKIRLTADKKNYLLGKRISITLKSPYRVDPPCNYFGVCGGCQLQHLDYSAQLALKKKHVFDKLYRIGELSEREIEMSFQTVVPSEEKFRYRNKNQYPVSKKNNKILIGFYKINSHNIVDLSDCLISQKVNNQVLDEIRGWMIRHKISAYNEKLQKGYMRHIIIRSSISKNKFIVGLVVNGDPVSAVMTLANILEKKFRNFISLDLIINKEKGNNILTSHIKNIYKTQNLMDFIEKNKYRINIDNFFQVNNYIAGRIYNDIKRYGYFSHTDTVYDLYCGLGVGAIHVGYNTKEIIGVDINEESIIAARNNAVFNNIQNAYFIAGDVKNFINDLTSIKNAKIIIDPPRKGIDPEVIEKLLELEPAMMFYISCYPATLARDIKQLKQKYHIQKIFIYDMFPQTIHVETLVILERK